MKVVFKLYLLAISAAVLLYLGCGDKGAKSDESGYVVDVFVGDVQVAHGQETGWKPVSSGMVLKESDIIKTGSDSYCDIFMPKRGILRISGNSVVYISKLAKNLEQLSVKKGKVLVNVAVKLQNDEAFKVETDSGVLAVRGTEFMVENDGQNMVTSVKDGTVKVSRKLNLRISDKVKDQVEDYLAVNVSRNESLEVKSGDNQEIEKEIGSKLENVSDIEEAKKIVKGVKDKNERSKKKAGDLKKEFGDLEKPEKIKKIETMENKTKDDKGSLSSAGNGEDQAIKNEKDKKALDDTMNNVTSKTGIKRIDSNMVNPDKTGASDEEYQKQLDDKMNKLKHRSTSSGASRSEPNADTSDDLLNNIKNRRKNK